MPSGSCLCGKLRYEHTGEVRGKAACYCLACQKISGGTNTINLLIPETDFHATPANSKEYTATQESGMQLTVHFCDNCGGIVYKTADRVEFKGLVVLLRGTIDEPEDRQTAEPELYTKHRVPWLPALDGAVQKEEF